MGSDSGHSENGRSRGLYMYSVSPFYQRPFAGFAGEIIHMFKSHIFGVALFGSLAAGGYWIASWANSEHNRLNRKPFHN